MNGTAAPRIVAVHGAPRSGTSWLGQLFNSSERVAYRYQPFFSHAFRGRIDAASDAARMRAFFADLLETDDDFVLQRGASALAGYELTFDKGATTHLAYKEVRFHDLLGPLLERLPDLHAVGLVRDPRAVIASWTAAPREFRDAWRLEDEWRDAPSKNAGQAENWYGFTRWHALARLFLDLADRYPARFTLVRYEDLVADTDATLARVFGAVGLPMSPQVRAFIARSASEDDGSAYGVLRNARRRPAVELDPGIRQAIESALQGDPAGRFLDPRWGGGQ